MKIDVYSHGLIVTDVTTERDLDAMMSFCKPMVEFGLEKRGKRFVPKPLRTYASATKNRREFHFHRNQLDELKDHLFQRRGYVAHLVPITYHEIGFTDLPEIDFKVARMYPPRPVQGPIIDYVLNRNIMGYYPNTRMVTLQPGGGKALADDTLVRVPGGWCKIGLLREGDNVIAADGSVTDVTGVYPQGDVQLYEVTFEDGRSVLTCGEHLWGVFMDNRYLVTDTLSIQELMRLRAEIYIPLITPDEGTGEDLPIHEYLETGTIVSQLEKALEAPVRQRWCLLEVLLHDLVGEGAKAFPEQAQALAAVKLIHSLGGIAKVVRTDVGDWHVLYNLERCRLKIRSIVQASVGSATCIAVRHPSKLFVVKGYLATHNTYIAQYCMNQIKRRTVIHFKGGYVERWKGDMEETFNFKKGEFLIVRGSKDLRALMQMGMEGTLKAHVIIITTATMREYIKDYEESNGRSKTYPVKPIDLYKTLGVGIVVKDELHQEFHNTFKMDIHTHVPLILGLSATMTSSDAFKNRMYDIAYPVDQRNDGGGIHRYIGVTEIRYHLDEEVRIRYKGAQGYSHIMFEESIMRHKGLLKNYLRLVEYEFYTRYVANREPGQKAIVFFARVEMCTLAMERFQKLYPELDVVRYVGSENDSYEAMLEADVIVSTLGSAGTAIDIPNLRFSFMTTAIDSRQSNEQVLGRTRPLKDWPDVTPEFIYFSCMEIEKHADYSRNKKEFFKGRVLYHKDEISRRVLTT